MRWCSISRTKPHSLITSSNTNSEVTFRPLFSPSWIYCGGYLTSAQAAWSASWHTESAGSIPSPFGPFSISFSKKWQTNKQRHHNKLSFLLISISTVFPLLLRNSWIISFPPSSNIFFNFCQSMLNFSKIAIFLLWNIRKCLISNFMHGCKNRSWKYRIIIAHFLRKVC